VESEKAYSYGVIVIIKTMDEKKKPEPKLDTKTKVVTIPGQKSAQDTSNWDDKAFGTPRGRDLIPALAKEAKDPSQIKNHIDPASRKKRPSAK